MKCSPHFRQTLLLPLDFSFIITNSFQITAKSCQVHPETPQFHFLTPAPSPEHFFCCKTKQLILFISFENTMLYKKQIIYFENMTFRSKIWPFPRKLIICFEIMFFSWIFYFSKENMYLPRKYDFSFENMNVSDKVNCLLRKYDFSFKMMPKWRLNVMNPFLLNAFGGSSWTNSFPKGAP